MTPTVLVALALLAPPTAADRGKASLLGTAFIPAFWPKAAVGKLHTQWGEAGKPADYPEALWKRYGLAPAPYPNGGLPMGLREAAYIPLVRGVGLDCMTCHGGRIMGESVVGLGNSSLDIQAVFEDMARTAAMPAKLPFAFSQARGTNEAGAFSVYLLGLRNDDLSPRKGYRDLGLHDDACEDVPAWWLLKKKRTMYYVGATDARSVRSVMQFMMHPLTTADDFTKAEPAFRDVMEYLLSIPAPKYPFPTDAKLAAAGKDIFEANCAKCHGTYGEQPTYPNRIIPLADIGTDRKRFDNIGPKFGEAYNASWFAKEPPAGKPVKATAGYQAPPLDGVWATAPYLHNGSVPTLAAVLDSTRRPKIFTRSFDTTAADYDTAAVGWKVEETPPPPATESAYRRRRVYDTTQPGRGNAGHTYGDDLSDADRKAVIEYLKTL